MAKKEIDNNGNSFVKVGNIRVTYKPNKKGKKTFSGKDVLSFRAYVDDSVNDALLIGPELSIKSSKTILKLIEAIALLCNEK